MSSRIPVTIIQAAPDAPVVCDMTTATDTPEERLKEYERLFGHALVRRARTDNAVVFTFAAKPGVHEWVLDLVRREAACCAFLSYQVELREREVVWTTSLVAGSAPPEILDEIYVVAEHFDEGFDGMLARLADNGVKVSPEAGRFVVDS